jgi:hypothetical protein
MLLTRQTLLTHNPAVRRRAFQFDTGPRTPPDVLYGSAADTDKGIAAAGDVSGAFAMCPSDPAPLCAVCSRPAADWLDCSSPVCEPAAAAVVILSNHAPGAPHCEVCQGVCLIPMGDVREVVAPAGIPGLEVRELPADYAGDTP